MLRSILVGLLAVSGAAACKGGGDGAPKVEPGVTVGKVVELTGSVTATRGSATRTLDPTSTVSGDDVITTPGDGRVAILLAHNNARWDLGPNKHERVGDSIAWGLPRADRPATAVDDTTTAAGRHAERSAANGESAAAPAAPAAGSGAMPAAGSGAMPPAIAEEPASGGERSAAPPADTKPAVDALSKGGRARDPKVGNSPPAPGGPPPPPRSPKPAQPKAQIGGKMNVQGDAPPDLQPKEKETKEDQNTPSDPGTVNRRSPVTLEKNKLADTGDPLQTAISKEREALHACVVAAGVDKVAIVFHVVKGKTTIEVAGGTDKDRACFGKIAARITLPADQTSTFPLSIPK